MIHSYPWYPADWRGSKAVMLMNAAERGIYRELLDYCWQDGSIPNDEVMLMKMARCTPAEWRKAWPVVAREFPLIDGVRRNPKVDERRPGLVDWHASRKRGGAIGNAKRWGKRSLSDGYSDHSVIAERSPSSSSSSSSSIEREARAPNSPSPPMAIGLAEDTLDRMAANEPDPVDPRTGREIFTRVLMDAVNPETAAAALIRDRLAYLEWSRDNRKTPKTLYFWVVDGWWKRPLPTAKPPEQASAMERLLKRSNGK